MSKKEKKAEEEKKVEKVDFQPPPRAPKYRIAKGRSVTCLKGTLDEGDRIEASYLPDEGDEAFNKLVDRGIVEKY